METFVICGVDISKSKVPLQTGSRENQPLISFQGRDIFSLNNELLSKHLLLLGSPGTGKTNTMNLILKDLIQGQKDGDLIFIFDTKGDYFDTFKGSSETLPIVLGNGRRYRNISQYWNLFYEIIEFDEDQRLTYSRDWELSAREMAKLFFEGKESSHQPFFHNAAADLISKIMIHFIRKACHSNNYEKLNNYHLGEFLKNCTKTDLERILMDEENKDFRGSLDYIQGENGQSQGVMSFIREMANDIFVGVFGGLAEGARGKQFSVKESLRTPGKKILFLEYDISTAKSLTPVYKVIVDWLLKLSLSQGGEEKNTYILLDELGLFPKISYLDSALTFGRSQGLKIIAGVQSVDLIYDAYGEHRGNVILSDFMNCFCYYLSDGKSREFIGKHFGTNYKNYSFIGGSQYVNTQVQGYNLEDWDILKLKTGQAVVKILGQDPFIYEFPLFSKMGG